MSHDTKMADIRRVIIAMVGSLLLSSATCGLSENLEDGCLGAKFSHELEKSKYYIALSVETPALGIFCK